MLLGGLWTTADLPKRDSTTCRPSHATGSRPIGDTKEPQKVSRRSAKSRQARLGFWLARPCNEVGQGYSGPSLDTMKFGGGGRRRPKAW